MNIRFKALLIATVFFLFATSIVQAHWKTSHYQIAVNAVKKAAVASEALKAIGFENGFDSELFFETVRVVTDDIPSMNEPNMISKNYTLSEWIGYGSEWEDGILAYRRYPLLGYEGITYGHFYDPWNDCGFMGEKDGVYKEIGQSLIDRANDTVSDSADEWPEVVMGPPNEWSYPMAKNYYYAALTGDSTKYKKWPCMRQFFRPYYSGRHEGKKNMNETERNRFFTWTFQTLGHILHLVADSSVPAHTRNDAHSIDPFTLVLPNTQGNSPFGDYDPFERWCWQTVKKDKDKGTSPEESAMKYYDEGSDSWTYWKDRSYIKAPDVFIDMEHFYNEIETLRGSFEKSLEQGLAEYSNANFLSKNTVFTHGEPERPDWFSDASRRYDPENVTIENRTINSVVHRDFVYLKKGDMQHFALCGVLYHLGLLGETEAFAPLFTVNDDKVNEDYAACLIPRAVGYSAGLLDYFFRGKLNITVNNDATVIDPFRKCIDHLELTVTNSTPDEAMTEGRLVLVVKYRMAEDEPYQYITEDISESFSLTPGQASDTIKVDLPCASESSEDTEQGIPLNAQEISLYVVYRGELGNETDGIAVGQTPLPMFPWLSVSVSDMVAPQDSTTDTVDADEKITGYLSVLDANIAYLGDQADYWYSQYNYYLSINDGVKAQSALEAHEEFIRERDYLINEKNHWIEMKIAIEGIKDAPTKSGILSDLTACYQTGCVTSLPTTWDAMPENSVKRTFVTNLCFDPDDQPVLSFIYHSKAAAVGNQAAFSSRNFIFASAIPQVTDPENFQDPELTIRIGGDVWIQGTQFPLMSEQTENQYDVGVPYHAEVAVRYSVIDGSKMPSWRHDAFMEVTLCAFDFTTDKEAHFDDKCDQMLNP